MDNHCVRCARVGRLFVWVAPGHWRCYCDQHDPFFRPAKRNKRRPVRRQRGHGR